MRKFSGHQSRSTRDEFHWVLGQPAYPARAEVHPLQQILKPVIFEVPPHRRGSTRRYFRLGLALDSLPRTDGDLPELPLLRGTLDQFPRRQRGYTRGCNPSDSWILGYLAKARVHHGRDRPERLPRGCPAPPGIHPVQGPTEAKHETLPRTSGAPPAMSSSRSQVSQLTPQQRGSTCLHHLSNRPFLVHPKLVGIHPAETNKTSDKARLPRTGGAPPAARSENTGRDSFAPKSWGFTSSPLSAAVCSRGSPHRQGFASSSLCKDMRSDCYPANVGVYHEKRT